MAACVTAAVHTRLVPRTAALAWMQPRCQSSVRHPGPRFINFIEIVPCVKCRCLENADAWRMEGQSSPGYLANGFWAWLVAAILTATSL